MTKIGKERILTASKRKGKFFSLLFFLQERPYEMDRRGIDWSFIVNERMYND
jgi:hypothetical protein